MPTPDEILAALRECVTVVRAGQTLVVRLDPCTAAAMDPQMFETYQGAIRQAAMETGVRTMLVVADGLGVLDDSAEGRSVFARPDPPQEDGIGNQQG